MDIGKGQDRHLEINTKMPATIFLEIAEGMDGNLPSLWKSHQLENGCRGALFLDWRELLRFNNRDAGISGEVGIVEGEDVRNAVHFH